MKSLVAGSLSLSHGPPPIVLFMNLKPEGATVTAHEQQLEIQTKNPSLGIAAPGCGREVNGCGRDRPSATSREGIKNQSPFFISGRAGLLLFLGAPDEETIDY